MKKKLFENMFLKFLKMTKQNMSLHFEMAKCKKTKKNKK